MNFASWTAIAAGALLLASCERQATGQVVAVVNGEEITLADLNGELAASGMAGSGNSEEARKAALQSLVDRKILAQMARERGIDKQPEYLQGERRAQDDILMSLLAQQVTRTIAMPRPEEANAFVASNPALFASRTLYDLDQIEFPAPPDRSKLRALEAVNDLEGVGAALDQMGIKYVRKAAGLDSLTAPPDLMRQILGLPAGEPFLLANGPVITVSVITGSRPAPLAGDEARAVAVEVMRRRAIADAAQRQVKQGRATAEIKYQPGFEPKKEAAASAS